MKRRNFFALLAAPFIARFLPKAKAVPSNPPFGLSIKDGIRIQRMPTEIHVATPYPGYYWGVK